MKAELVMKPKIGLITGVRHETYARKKDIKEGVQGILNQTYERIIIKGKEKKVLKEVEFAYMSVSKTLDLPIADYDSLQKIDSYLKSKNSYPRPFEKKEN